MAVAPAPQLIRAERPLAALVPQIGRFACVGAASTALHLGVFALIQGTVGLQVGNLAALLIATVANTAVNRRWTFGIAGTTDVARHHVQALLVFGLTLALSSGALWLVPHVTTPSTTVSTAALGISMVGSTLIRFAAMRAWIFRQKS